MADPAALRQSFLEGMSQAACTVNIVTTDGPAGRYGVTVSAMSSVSADSTKPSLLVCVHHKSNAAEAIQRNGVFCVNVLRDDQADVSDTFAGRIKTADGDKFSSAQWVTQATGAPRIVDPLVAFDCRLAQSLRYGSHHVFFGEVEDMFVATGGHPLIYANRAYGRPARIEPRNLTVAGAGRRAHDRRAGDARALCRARARPASARCHARARGEARRGAANGARRRAQERRRRYRAQLRLPARSRL